MKMRSVLLLTTTLCLCVILGLSACVQRWTKPGGTQHEFDAMKSACAARSYSRFPPMVRQVQLTTGYTTQITTQCTGSGNSVNCYTTGGQYTPPEMMTIDDNQGARNQDTRSCFFENGWEPAKD